MQANSPLTQFDNLLHGLDSRMVRAIARIIDDPHDAEDALQNALTTIWQKLSRLRQHPNPKAVVLKVCIDAAYDLLRNRRRTTRWETNVPLEQGSCTAS